MSHGSAYRQRSILFIRRRHQEIAPESRIYFAVELFANYAGRASELTSYTTGAQINYDRDLRLQYLVGEGLNHIEGDKIYADILLYIKFPADLFSGSEATITRLRTAVETASAGKR